MDGDTQLSLQRASFFLIVRGVLMVLLTTAVFAMLHYYIGYRLLVGSGLARPIATAGWVILAFLFASVPAGFAASRSRARGLADVLQWVSYAWIGAFGLLLTALVATDILHLFVPGFVARLQAETAVALVFPALGWGAFRARHPVLERRTFQVKDLPPALDGFKLVQVTDLHIGPTLGRKFLETVVARVNALSPDVVAVTGDVVDGFVPALRDQVAPLAALKSRFGAYYVTGNHELYYGAGSWEKEMARLGLHVLHNEHRVIEKDGGKLVLAGVTDYDGGNFAESHASDPVRALRGAPSDVPRILLAHQPRSAFRVAGERVDLQLSGHTHGGQIFPFMFFVRLQQPVIRGLATIGGVRVYTSRGTGYWGPPVRLGAPPELTEITLVRA